MDRRSLITVFIFTLILIGVNMYFEQQDQEQIKTWKAQKQAQSKQQKAKLEESIVLRTAKPNQLPIVTIYRDAEAKDKIGEGILSGEGVMTILDSAPEKIFILDSKSNKINALARKFKSENGEAFSIYTPNDKALLSVGQLNYFGTTDLQTLAGGKVYLAEYVDGTFVFPQKKLAELSKTAEEPTPKNLTEVPTKNAIVLVKQDQTYLPVGVYLAKDQDFIGLQTIETIEPLISLAPYSTSESSEAADERYYVLQDAYQQLVFSTRGGALAEINLALKDSEHPNSYVLPVEEDKEMLKRFPRDSYFPEKSYFIFRDGEKLEMQKGSLGGFYPLIRRDILSANNNLSRNVPAQYYAANIVSEYPEMAELSYKVKEFTTDKIVFEAKQPHRRITKTYKLDSASAPYCFNLDVEIEGDNRGLWLTSGVPEVEMVSSAPAPTLKYRITRNNKPEVFQLDLPSEAITNSQERPDWISNSNGFFGIIMDPLTEVEGGFRVLKVPGTTVPSRVAELGTDPDTLPGYMTLLPLKAQSGRASYRFFAGPFSTPLLESIDKHYSTPDGYNPDYIASQNNLGWFGFISGPFAKFLFWLMSIFHAFTNSWGLSIILLTVALRIMMYPLNAWSLRSSMRMQQISPEVSALQEKYKKDPQKAQMEVMKLYRDRGVNPFTGCVPLLIQLPFLIGMFDLLKSSFELRGASFIPGWIDNLAAPDVLFSWNYPLPIIGNQFHLLPIVSGAIMFLQQRYMSPTPSDPSQLSDKDRQQRAAGTIFAFIFTFMFYNFPSGINIYWISTSLLGILQQWWTKRTLGELPPPKPEVIVDKKTKK